MIGRSYYMLNIRISIYPYWNIKKKARKETKGISKLFKKFGISPGAKILDFCCGIGRHSIPLVDEGFELTGYDPSPYYLKIAKKTASEMIPDPKRRPTFVNGGPYRPSRILLKNKHTDFDAIIIMDNSFGYRGESNDHTMIKELFKVAKKDCILLIETENRDWRLSNFEPVTFFNSKRMEIRSVWKFNFEKSVSEGISMFYEKEDGNESTLLLRLKLPILMRLYSLHELKKIIENSGWKYIESYDDIVTLEPFSNGNMSIFTIYTAK